MAKIEGIRIKNFRDLKDVVFGKQSDDPDSEALTAMTVVIGKNGVGKSTLFDVFGFLADSLKFGVEEACDLRGRGGFHRLRSQGQTGPIKFAINYREDDNAHPITYKIAVDLDNSDRPFVRQEILLQQSDEKDLIFFLMLSGGAGFALKNEDKRSAVNTEGFAPEQASKLLALVTSAIQKAEQEARGIVHVLNEIVIEMGENETEAIALNDNRKLGIATLGALKQHPRISAFRQFVEGWYLSYFSPDAARGLPLAGSHPHLNSKGDNLANVVQFMEREHRVSFQKTLTRIAEKIPGIHSIDTEKTVDGRLLLRFNDKGFQYPFYASQMSDGILKLFAYLLLLEDPSPPPFICIEEPENGLYHNQLETLASEFRTHATGLQGSSQLFITTHQPYFVDALEPNEVWILEKGEDGFSTIRRVSEDKPLSQMVADGLSLGGLWSSDYLNIK
jgi:predicted ATPase